MSRDSDILADLQPLLDAAKRGDHGAEDTPPLAIRPMAPKGNLVLVEDV